MRYLVSSEQLSFFTYHGMISFEQLLLPEKIEILKNGLKKEKKDLWRQSEEIKKIIFDKKCSEIAKLLSQHSILRIAFDLNLSDPLLTESSFTLKEICSFKPVACGLALDLVTGEGLFVSPDFPITPMGRENKHLIVYCGSQMTYTHEPKDPYLHLPKKMGYGFGDCVTTTTHPIVRY